MKSKRRSLLPIIVLVSICFTLNPFSLSILSDPSEAQTKNAAVSVIQYVETSSLDAVRDGLKEALEKAGYVEGKNLKWQWQNAEGDPTKALQIAKDFASQNPDLLVAISTPASQAAAKATQGQRIPLVFSAVTDPVKAGLVNSLEKPGGRITGVSDRLPTEAYLALIKAINPEVDHVGVLYNPNEINSLSQVNELEQAAPKYAIDLVKSEVDQSSDVASAGKKLVGKVDAVYLPTDNTVTAAIEDIIQVGKDHKIPIYGADTDSVDQGTLAAYSQDYYAVGLLTGSIAVKILSGTNPEDIPVQTTNEFDLYIRLSSADSMGVKIPTTVLQKATKVLP